MQLGRDLLREEQPAAVVGQLVVRVDPALHADLGGAEGDRIGNPLRELLLAHVVGVGRALALAEAAERAADGADVREVDVPVDDEGRDVPGQLGAQLVRRAAHLRDHLGPRLSEQRGQLILAQHLAAAAPLDRARSEGGVRLRLAAAPRAPARDEAPKAELDHVENPLLHPLGVEVLRVGAEPLAQRVAARREVPAHLGRAREGVLGRDVVAVGGEAAEVGRAGLDQLAPPIGEVGRNLHSDVRHQPLGLSDQPLHVGDGHLGGPVGAGERGIGGETALPAAPRRLVGDLRHLLPVVARVGDEVLQDHLLEVAVPGVRLGERLQRGDTLLLALADADEDAAGERDLELAGRLDRLQAAGGVLGGRALVHGLHQPLGHRLEHQPLRGGHLAQPGEVLAPEDADVGVRQDPALQRALAGPAHVRGEVLVAPGAELLRHERIDLGPLAREHQQLLGAALQRLVEQALDLPGIVDVRLPRREGAVLAVAPAGPRQGQRVVPREGDPLHRTGTLPKGVIAAAVACVRSSRAPCSPVGSPAPELVAERRADRPRAG